MIALSLPFDYRLENLQISVHKSEKEVVLRIQDLIMKTHKRLGPISLVFNFHEFWFAWDETSFAIKAEVTLRNIFNATET